MKLFHGTTKDNLLSIQSEGISSPSYWGTEIMAKDYAASFGDDGVVLVAEITESDLSINRLVAESLYDDGDLEEMPDEKDLVYSLEFLEGLVCTTAIFYAEVVEPEIANPETLSLKNKAKMAWPEESFAP